MKNKHVNGYQYSRTWFDWACENADKVKPTHTALYFWLIEKNNRLGWCPSFGLPTDEAMHYVGIGSPKTYANTLDDLIKFGFVEMVKKSNNQYGASIVALVNFTEADVKQTPNHIPDLVPNLVPEQVQSRCSINKLETIKQETIKHTLTNVSVTTQESENFVEDFVGKKSEPKPETSEPVSIEPSKMSEPAKQPQKPKIYAHPDFDFPTNWGGDKKNAFQKWLNYKIELKDPYKTESGIKTIIGQFSKCDIDKIDFCVSQSISNEWRGLFWEKYNSGSKNTDTPRKTGKMQESHNSTMSAMSMLEEMQRIEREQNFNNVSYG